MSTDVALRPELEPLPARLVDLPVDPERGYPVPWFVEWIDGKPEFRVMSLEKWSRAIKERLCWVCGKRLGTYMAFVIGPMCGINRTTSEPPCHLTCAQWSARNCPFLSRPHMVRREDELTSRAADNTAGYMLKRNPGVTLVWITRAFQLFRDGKGGMLIEVGEPMSVEWWCEGRPAKRAEVEDSIRTGLPALEELAKAEPGGMEHLEKCKRRLARLLPSW